MFFFLSKSLKAINAAFAFNVSKIVSIKIKLNDEGEVIYTKLLTDRKLNNPFFRAASESAMRAVNHPECKKLQVPKKKYETWKEIILDFDPSQSLI